MASSESFFAIAREVFLSGRWELANAAACQRARPALTSFPYLSAREGAAGQAVVCPLLRGRSPTRGVAPKQHRGLRRAFSPAFRAGSLYPLARGCRTSWRGEGWFRRRDAARPARAA